MSENCNPSRRVIAHGMFCVVEECRCGVLHITVGASTVRLQHQLVVAIWQTVGEALTRLGYVRRRDDEPAPSVNVREERRSSERPS